MHNPIKAAKLDLVLAERELDVANVHFDFLPSRSNRIDVEMAKARVEIARLGLKIATDAAIDGFEAAKIEAPTNRLEVRAGRYLATICPNSGLFLVIVTRDGDCLPGVPSRTYSTEKRAKAGAVAMLAKAGA